MDINKIVAASNSIDMDGLVKANHANKVKKGQPLEVSELAQKATAPPDAAIVAQVLGAGLSKVETIADCIGATDILMRFAEQTGKMSLYSALAMLGYKVSAVLN